jgi:hypothetical protein
MLKLNKEAYQELVDEDIAWLEQFPNTLERRHIALVLRDSVYRLYPTNEEHAPILIPLIKNVSSMSLAGMYEIEEDNSLHFNCHGEYTRDENRNDVIKEARAIAIEKAEKKSKSFWHNFYKG